MKFRRSIGKLIIVFSFLFVFNMTVSASDSYSFGDKVKIGDFGGHVIEASDENTSTVKVFIDGWNKTSEEWDKYWVAYFKGSKDKLYYNDIDFNLEDILKEQINNKDGFDFKYATSDDASKLLNISKYEKIIEEDDDLSTSISTYVVSGEVPSWLLEDNYNLYGTGLMNVYGCDSTEADGTCDVIFLNGFNAAKLLETEYPQPYAVAPSEQYINICKKSSFSTTGLCDVMEEANTKYFFNVYGNYISKVYDMLENNNEENNIILYNFYPIVTIDKSNLESKCGSYDEDYTITYETNGGEKIDSVIVTGNKELTIPKREGYVFDGWYLDSAFKDKVTVIKPISIMENECIIGNKDVTVYAKWKKEIKDEKVSLLADEDIISKIKSVEVKLQDKIDAHNIDVLKSFVAYDIILKDNDGNSVEPSGKVKLSISIPENYDKNNVGIYGLEGDTLVLYETTINGEYAEAYVEHFSTYIIGEKNDKSNESKDNNIDNKLENPDTSDNLIIYMMTGLILILVITLYVRRMKKVR